MKYFPLILLIGVVIACAPPTAPSPAVSSTAKTVTQIAIETITTPPVLPPVAPTPLPPPIAADPPVVVVPAPSCQPLNPSNIAWRGPFSVEIPGSCFVDSWRAERVDIASGALNGSGSSPAIPANGRGTITLNGSMECGRTYQVDLFRSGSSQMFAAAGIVYPGPACPPPPPTCVIQAAGPCGEWTLATSSVNTMPVECTKRPWVRACPLTCGAPARIEGPVLSCERPQ